MSGSFTSSGLTSALQPSLKSAQWRVEAKANQSEAEAARGMESMFFKELVQAAGAFSGENAMPGASVLTDLVSDTLAELLADKTSLGVAEALGLDSTQPASSDPPRLGAYRALGHHFDAPTDLSRVVDSDHARVSSDFGHRHDPFTQEARFHSGVDIAAEHGAPVSSLGAGVVTFAGDRGGYGQMVEVEHADGRRSRYAHLSAIEVIAGQEISAGQSLGAVGESGRATGPHLHLEMRKGNIPQDPMSALRVSGSRSDSLLVGTLPAGSRKGGQR